MRRIKLVITIKSNTEQEQIKMLVKKLEDKGIQVNMTVGEPYTILALIGDTSNLDTNDIESLEFVEKVVRIQQPYKKANRLFKPESTVIKVGDKTIGGKKLAIIAGPCSVESKEQIIKTAEKVKEFGAGFLRGGAFKPRTSPYSFQGLKEEGLELLKMARVKTGLPIVSEIMSQSMLERFVEDVDIIQIGARNMQNFDLLREVGRTNKPILLKRGFSSTIEEFLMSAEYIMAEGNPNVILCERGIRTFENYTRNTLDLSAIPAIKKLSHLPIIVDPSHAAGMWWMVEPLSKAAIAAGADGLMIEVHNDPANALCDGQESIKPEKFRDIMEKLKLYAKIEGREI